TFSAAGTYTLTLSAADGVHAVAYDAVIVNSLPPLSVARAAGDLIIRFASASGQRYRVEWCDSIADPRWQPLGGEIVGTGGEVAVTDPGALIRPARFYQLVALP
ncbi:MAG TPA: hypothetical protein VF683_04835, partial [Chthoniobacterales bacterium]